MQQIKTRDVLKYSLLPGVMPRVKTLFGSGFGHLCFLMAQIYILVGLLPQNHPYGNPQNIGRFGMRHVIAEAANRLVISTKNIDKILIFFAILIGAIILVTQLVLITLAFFVPYAFAVPAAFTHMFDTQAPEQDVAFALLARVFGVPGMFCSIIDTSRCTDVYSEAGYPFAIHDGLHALLKFYSYGLLLIGVLIFIYFVVVIVAETAVTGTPFGQRFKNVWVPIRLVMAIGLLVPLNFGLNSGQYIALYTAKLGSSIATNGWLAYNKVIADRMGDGHNPLGEKETLIGVPLQTDIKDLLEFMSYVHTCAYSLWYNERDTSAPPSYQDPSAKIQMYMVKTEAGSTDNSKLIELGTSHVEALAFFKNSDIHIAFGHESDDYTEPGKVKPYCGTLVIPVSDVSQIETSTTDPVTGVVTVSQGGSDKVLDAYFELVKTLWLPGTPSDPLKFAAVRFSHIVSSDDEGSTVACGPTAGIPTAGTAVTYLPPNTGTPPACATTLPGTDWMAELYGLNSAINAKIYEAWETYVREYERFEISDEILLRGWAGAGLWYHQIADLNGIFMTSVLNVPAFKLYPIVMEETRTYKKQRDNQTGGTEMFNPQTRGNIPIPYTGDAEPGTRAKILYEVHKTWNGDRFEGMDPKDEFVYNTFLDAMNMILGIHGIFDIRGYNAPTHPLTQLVMVGKGLVDSTIRNLSISAASAFSSGMFSFSLARAASSMFSGTAFIGLTAGVVLYYVLPFLPFVYFFFAVGTWIKSIFEAMVGVPLWALAHLRIDGEGLPGESASNGYFLIFEIGIRPIITVFALVAALLIFTAQVRILNFIWDLVIQNAGGFDTGDAGIMTLPVSEESDKRIIFERNIIDQYFFTILYTIVVYMLATASFKLIDNIPNNILRWMGAGVTAFGDTNQDPTEGLTRYVAVSGMVQGQQLATAGVGLAEGAGKLAGQATGANRLLQANRTANTTVR